MLSQQLSFLSVLLVGTCYAHIGGQLSLPDQSQTYCGRNLARALSALCYDEPLLGKRSGTGTMYNAVLTPYYKEQEMHVDWPWLMPYKARGMSSQRGKRQVVNECCDKPCSISELFTYCDFN